MPLAAHGRARDMAWRDRAAWSRLGAAMALDGRPMRSSAEPYQTGAQQKTRTSFLIRADAVAGRVALVYQPAAVGKDIGGICHVKPCRVSHMGKAQGKQRALSIC